MSQQRDKHYQEQITEANLYVRKIAVTDFVLSSIGTNAVKNTSRKQLFLSFKEDFCLVVIGVQSWQQEDVFAKEPVR